MSFILDALKKSESDRQRQTGPSLFEVKVAPPRRTLPVWAVAIAVLLAINVVVISWMLLRHAPAQQPAPASAPAVSPPAAALPRTAGASPSAGGTGPAPSTANAAPAAGASPAASAAASAAHSIPAGAAAPAANAATSHAGSGRPPAAAPVSSPTPQGAGPPPVSASSSDDAPAIQPAAAQDSGSSEDSSGALPLYQQIVTSDGLPALHLDLHVYAHNPKDRFVMINMHRLGEGDSLPDGVQVVAIRPDGVVLSYRGTQFLLPRD